MDFDQLLSMAEQSHEKTSLRPNNFKSTQVRFKLNQNIFIYQNIMVQIDRQLCANIYVSNPLRLQQLRRILKQKSYPTMLKSF